MTAKTFEVRDRLTFIPVLAVRMEPGTEQDRYLIGRSGFGTMPEAQRRWVWMSRLTGGDKCVCNPSDWEDRTLQVAHGFIKRHFDELDSGSVVDVEHILGETADPKRSEAAEAPL